MHVHHLGAQVGEQPAQVPAGPGMYRQFPRQPRDHPVDRIATSGPVRPVGGRRRGDHLHGLAVGLLGPGKLFDLYLDSAQAGAETVRHVEYHSRPLHAGLCRSGV